MLKFCKECKLDLELASFSKRGKNGYQNKCKECKKKYANVYNSKFKELAHVKYREKRNQKIEAGIIQPRQYTKPTLTRTEKKCWHCETTKSLTEFHKSKKLSDGHATECKPCKKILDKEYRTKHGKELSVKVNSAKKIARKNNPEHYKAKGRFYANHRRALKIQGSLNNQYNAQIEEIYFNCPKGFHVDHIIPLNNSLVCGLHVPWNLQYLTAEENLKKGNKLCQDQ